MQTAVEVPVRTIVCSVVAHHIVTVHPNDRMIFGCFHLILAPKLSSLHVDCLCTRMQRHCMYRTLLSDRQRSHHYRQAHRRFCRAYRRRHEACISIAATTSETCFCCCWMGDRRDRGSLLEFRYIQLSWL
jgi:hypothetical protein